MVNKNQTRAFTLIEILVVVSIIAMLAAFLLVALSSSQDSAKTAKANVKLKEIGSWMQLWAGDNNNQVLPSQFDFTDEAESGSPITTRRDVNAPDDNLNDTITRGQYQGTWTDILWTDNNLHQSYGLSDKQQSDPMKLRWESDSPDNDIYEIHTSFSGPFRSPFMNTRGIDVGLPGYFAANDFFDARSAQDKDNTEDSRVDRYYTYAMMHAPARSVYLVDSMAGETISVEPEAWEIDVTTGGGPVTQATDEPTGEIDFRYGDDCLMLLLDGSIVRVAPWSERGPEASPTGDVDHSLFGRGYRVHQLTKRKPTP
jgi:prepilin-type N-terminal cleavage/methylation domain-containing protein